MGGATIWLTGLPGAGKSTIAAGLRARLGGTARTRLLDADELRTGINADLGFSEVDRRENARRIGELAIDHALSGCLVIVTCVSPYATSREHVRRRHESFDVPFVEVHVATPLVTCEARDPKGLYASARAGLIGHFTGVTAPYEAPEDPDLRLSTMLCRPEDSVGELVEYLRTRGLLPTDAVATAT